MTTAPNSQSGYWPERQPAVRINWDDLIPDCPFDWEELIPPRRSKATNRPGNRCPDDWMVRRHAQVVTLKVSMVLLNGVVKAVGPSARLTIRGKGTCHVDFDGPDAVDKFRDVFNREPSSIFPHRWRHLPGKEMRARLFIVDQIAAAPQRRCFWTLTRTAKPPPRTAGWPSISDRRRSSRNRGIQLDDGQQHCLERDVAPAPDWLSFEPLVQLEEKLHHIEPSADDAARLWRCSSSSIPQP